MQHPRESIVGPVPRAASHFVEAVVANWPGTDDSERGALGSAISHSSSLQIEAVEKIEGRRGAKARPCARFCCELRCRLARAASGLARGLLMIKAALQLHVDRLYLRVEIDCVPAELAANP